MSKLQRLLSNKDSQRKEQTEEDKQEDSAYVGSTMAGSTVKQNRYPGHGRSGSKADNFLNQELTDNEVLQAQTMPRQSKEARRQSAG